MILNRTMEVSIGLLVKVMASYSRNHVFKLLKCFIISSFLQEEEMNDVKDFLSMSTNIIKAVETVFVHFF